MRPTLKGTAVALSTAAATAGVLLANPGSLSAAPDPATGLAAPAGAASAAPANAPDLDPAPVPPSAPAATPAPAAAPEPAPAPADVVYTGTTIDTRYGPMQVQATISGGVIADITWLQLPSDGHSRGINDYAAPALVEEALAAQSADVSTISGATYTSTGFRQSLQSILDEAGL